MREIKFRVVWNKEVSNEAFTIGEFVDGVEMSFKDGGTLPFKEIDWQTDTVEYLQYTGLKDKNGKEIYEGDVMRILYTDWPSQSAEKNGRYSMSLEEYKKSISSIGFVQWENDRWIIIFDKRGSGRMDAGPHGEKEVIGNIYDNPELIEK